MYTTRRSNRSIDVNEYLRDYVDVEGFLECCKVCPNYKKSWGCPPYDFDVISYWRRYSTLYLIAEEILLDAEHAGKPVGEEKINSIVSEVLGSVKDDLTEYLLRCEAETEGSVYLSAGSCRICDDSEGGCTRSQGKPCRYPERVRYSIESLGGNVEKTLRDLMGIDIEWMKDGILPNKFVLICGLLIP